MEQKLVSLPARPANIKIATAAETAQQPAPHMEPPPFLHNTGQKGTFVLPLNAPAGARQTESQKYDDFAFDAASWTLTARSPGQAGSHFYGYTRLIELREDVEKALGAKFDQTAFHDFLLRQGPLPPDCSAAPSWRIS